MKRRNGKLAQILGVSLCAAMVLSACGSEEKRSERDDVNRPETESEAEAGGTESGTSIADVAANIGSTETAGDSAESSFSFTTFANDTDRMMQDAIAQYNETWGAVSQQILDELNSQAQ